MQENGLENESCCCFADEHFSHPYCYTLSPEMLAREERGEVYRRFSDRWEWVEIVPAPVVKRSLVAEVGLPLLAALITWAISAPTQALLALLVYGVAAQLGTWLAWRRILRQNHTTKWVWLWESA